MREHLIDRFPADPSLGGDPLFRCPLLQNTSSDVPPLLYIAIHKANPLRSVDRASYVRIARTLRQLRCNEVSQQTVDMGFARISDRKDGRRQTNGLEVCQVFLP